MRVKMAMSSTSLMTYQVGKEAAVVVVGMNYHLGVRTAKCFREQESHGVMVMEKEVQLPY